MTLRVPRRRHFKAMMRKTAGFGIAVENNCAIEVVAGKFYEVVRSKSYARAYAVYRQGREVISEQLPKSGKLTPIESLYRRARRG
jgi:hypothetical protein